MWGGKTGTKPIVRSWTLRWYTPHLLFDPIDYTMLNTLSDQPNVLVTVKGLPSVCTGNCKYSFLTNTPKLLLASMAGSVVTLVMNDPGSLGYALSDVAISLAGQECKIIDESAPINNFKCQLPLNADSIPSVPAGDHIPRINVAQVGLIAPSSSVAPFNFPLTITTIDISAGNSYGGYTLTLKGVGFPLSISDATITMCGVATTILSLTNI